MKVVFANRYFHPDISATSQILTDLAVHLARDNEVHVVTSRQRYDDPRERLASDATVSGVIVHRVWTTHFGRGWLPGRAVDYVTFYLSATWRLWRLLRAGDIAVPMTDPPLLSIPASFAARRRGARVVNWLQDVFPETAAALGVPLARGIVGSALVHWRNHSLERAARNVVLGELMEKRLEDEGVPAALVTVIHNWSVGESVKPLAASENALRAEWGLQGKFVVGYSGNMGRAHDLDILLEAAQRLSGHEDIAFLFIGSGSQRDALERRARDGGLRNVTFQPYQPRERLGASLTVPDCHVVSLKPSLEGLVVPSKLYSSLAAGRPVLFVGAADGEIGRLVRAHDIGRVADPSDAAAIAAAILELREGMPAAGARGRALFEREFDAPVAMARWSRLLAEVKAAR